jgi:hypothetical protein
LPYLFHHQTCLIHMPQLHGHHLFPHPLHLLGSLILLPFSLQLTHPPPPYLDHTLDLCAFLSMSTLFCFWYGCFKQILGMCDNLFNFVQQFHFSFLFSVSYNLVVTLLYRTYSTLICIEPMIASSHSPSFLW